MISGQIFNPRKLKDTRRSLRKRQTSAEGVLWQFLRRKDLGIKFHRQFGIGPYIVDFCCRKKKIIIEADGEIHNRDYVRENDIFRSQYLEKLGYKIIRFKNKEVIFELNTVLEKIKNTVALP